MSFTGERLPAADADFAVDRERHLAAYRFARAHAAGRAVLDAGSGEGYGAALLAEVAARVVGIDRPEAVRVAAARHRAPGLEFRAHELERLGALGERFDLVVSFQVIEHVRDPVGFLRALARCGGALVVTTPNRLMSVSENPYHLREWTAAEVLALAAPVVLAVPVGIAFSKPTFWSEDLAVPSFVAVRPLSSEDLVATKVKVATVRDCEMFSTGDTSLPVTVSASRRRSSNASSAHASGTCATALAHAREADRENPRRR